MKTEVVKASEMREKVFQRIWDIRTGEHRAEQRKQYEREAAAYLKAKGKRQEITINTATLDGGFEIEGETWGKLADKKTIGFIKRDGVTFVPRPVEPRIQDEPPAAWAYSGRQRIGSQVFAARSHGLLADAEHNREIRPERVEQYVNEMVAGKWVDLLSDPIAITTEGQVLNGQHRLAAIWDCLHDEYVRGSTRGMNGTDPAFLVVWGVDPREALYADGSRRTAVDEKTIAVKLVKAKSS